MASQGRGARAKGSNFELKIAKFMSGWWGGNFTRTPGSGGLRWGSDQRIAGDIVPPEGLDFPFVIECKKHESFSLDNFLLNTGTPMDWWMQVVTDCRRLNQDKTKEQKTPLLIFSKNRAKVYVALPYKAAMYLKLNINGNAMRTTIVTKDIRGDEQDFDVIITTLDDFATIPIADLQKFGKTVEWDAYADQYE